MKPRVVVTGLGVSAPIGTGVAKFWDALVAGKNGIGPITLFDASALRSRIAGEVLDLNATERLSSKVVKRAARFTQLGLVAAMEALANAGKHSRSNRVRIELARRDERVHLEIRDWGVGFVPSSEDASVLGLNGMAKRARIAGGRCSIESAPGAGTRILVDLPYVARQ